MWEEVSASRWGSCPISHAPQVTEGNGGVASKGLRSKFGSLVHWFSVRVAPSLPLSPHHGLPLHCPILVSFHSWV